MQERDHFSLGAIKLELKNSSKRGSYCCSESGSEGWSTTRLSESDMSSDGVMRQHERWTVKEEQTLKKWVNMVKNGDVSWKKAAAAVSSAGRERTISAVRCCCICCPSVSHCSVLLSRIRIPIVVLV